MPQLVSETHQRLRLFWSWALMSPFIYLFAGRIMLDTGYIATTPGAAHPWNTLALRLVLGLIGVALLAANLWLRFARRAQPPVHSLYRPQALRRVTVHFYTMATLADSLSGVGLLYFMASGHFWGVLAGGAASYLAYAIAYPQRRDIEIVTQLQQAGE